MSDRPRYRVHLRRGHSVDAIEVAWLPGRLRAVMLVHRLELDHDARTGHKVPDGVVAREYPLAAVQHVEDLDPPEARRGGVAGARPRSWESEAQVGGVGLPPGSGRGESRREGDPEDSVPERRARSGPTGIPLAVALTGGKPQRRHPVDAFAR